MYQIRHATKKEARPIQELIRRVGINPVGLNWKRFLVVVNEDDRMLGCGQIKPHSDGTREMASIAVVPEHQGKGIGRLIITRLMENEPPPLYITCRSTMGAYYQQFGFEQILPPNLPPYFLRIWRLANLLNRLFPPLGRMWVMVKRTDRIESEKA